MLDDLYADLRIGRRSSVFIVASLFHFVHLGFRRCAAGGRRSLCLLHLSLLGAANYAQTQPKCHQKTNSDAMHVQTSFLWCSLPTNDAVVCCGHTALFVPAVNRAKNG